MTLIPYDSFTSPPILYVIPGSIRTLMSHTYIKLPLIYTLPLITYITCSFYMLPVSSICSLFVVNCMHSPYDATHSICSPLILYTPC